MTEVARSPGVLGSHHDDASEVSLSTLPDPRTASSSDLSRTGSHSPRHPDLSAEVAALSDKLITAINHQTTLDDTLAQTRHELEAARARVRQLEAEAKEYEEKLASGALLTRDAADDAQDKLVANLEAERRQKSMLQQEKRGIEMELETLTVSLFEEANKMVAAANQEKDAIQRKNQQLRDQVRDTEMLLASQQEQLMELKNVMQQMSSDRDEQESVRASTAPSSPAVHKEETFNRLMEVMNLSPVTPGDGDISPAPSTTFTHLLKPICRIDLPAYEDYRQLIAVAKSQPASRVTSGTYAGLNVMGLAGLGPSSQSGTSTPNGTGSHGNMVSPSTPGSFTPPGAKDPPVPLKETKFYKRILSEDVEPTLRLDIAPGISWLNRRSLLSAICEGSLIVEPIPDASRKLYGRYTTCSVCGENRKGDENPRTHRMRTSDADGASRWQLCQLCLEKVRATCDLVGFVRMIKDGVVRIREGDPEAEQEVWEELVRLRERMFWARMAAGVIPAFMDRKGEKVSLGTGRRSHESRRSVPETPPSTSKPLSDPEMELAEPKDSSTKIPIPETADSTSVANESQTSINGTDEANSQLQSALQQSIDDQHEINEKENASAPPLPERSSDRKSDNSNKPLTVSIPGGFE
ncbi:putative gdp gtp exchange factor sec2p [Phaeomoniella chlamydospora]|uniref:Putative gdp gtp exchange factor sec2p n=1 Tax=Phaeomoniella chlamydospora TaxID=158046 RepID=A0A0G2GBH0_PHACM|nr:putative gdp gtp exchange factor sec2p [Phaeomoniella chlamydospora]